MGGPRILLIILLWPVGEIVSMLLMAEAVGALATLALLVLGVLAGVAALRFAGRAALEELRAEAMQGGGRLDLRIFAGASRLALIGVLLVVPGFLSDIVALALFAMTFFGGGLRRLRRPPVVIDAVVERRIEDQRRGGAGF